MDKPHEPRTMLDEMMREARCYGYRQRPAVHGTPSQQSPLSLHV
jgi:hypothetical protein